MTIELRSGESLLPSGSRVLCAVSGGADSMCLLHLLKSREAELGIQIFAAHYEHGLRREESLRDCAFVETWCRKNGVPCAVEHGDVRAYAAAHRLGVEEAARALRYDFLERAASDFGCDRIATAHNADDNAETMLLNLTRGSGAAGLCGIPPVRGKIVRPLLQATRAEIDRYLAAHGVPHVEDSSNADERFSRNRIRRQVMPALRELNPAFAGAAGRTAALLREDNDCLERMAADFIGEHYNNGALPLDALCALPRAISSRVLRRLCPQSLNREHVDMALRFAGGEGLGWLDLPGIRLRREQGRLYMTGGLPAPITSRVLLPGTVTDFPEAGFRVKAEFSVCTGEEIHSPFKTYCFKCEKLYGSVSCTSRRPGDTIRPVGRGVTKTLKSLFLEAGLTQAERDATPVFRDEEGVLAVHGLALAQRAAARIGDPILRLELIPNT